MVKSRQRKDGTSVMNAGLTSFSASVRPTSPHTPLTTNVSQNHHRQIHRSHKTNQPPNIEANSSEHHYVQPYHTYEEYSLDTLIGGESNSSSGGYDPDDYSTNSSFFPPNGHEVHSNDTSHQYQHLHGKLSRPRRRTGAAIQNKFSSHKRPFRTDTSVASESSEGSRISRFSSSSSRFSKGFKSQNHLHQSYKQEQQPIQYASSYNSLLWLGTTGHPINNNDSTKASTIQASSTALHEYQNRHHSNESPVGLFSSLYFHHQQKSISTSQTSTSHNPDSPKSPTGSSPPPLPSIKVVVSELYIYCSLYFRYKLRSVRKPCRRLRRRLLVFFMTLLALVIAIAGWIIVDLYMESVAVCTPPLGNFVSANFPSFLDGADVDVASFDGFSGNKDNDNSSRRPLVEYYVHGRGIGHYARSVAIVERLNQAGIE
jgi:hypothetical protein